MRPYSVGRNLVAGTKTTLFVVPNKQIAKWNLLYATNLSASAKNFSAWWYDKSANTEIAILTDYPLTAKGYVKFDNSYVTLEEGDEIRVLSETGSTAAVIITVEVENAPAVAYIY